MIARLGIYLVSAILAVFFVETFYYAYFQAILNEVEYPHVDFLQKILERAQDVRPETLYVNNGKDPNHLSPSGNRLLAKTIFESLTSS